MTNSDLTLPWFTSHLWVLLVFIVATAAFHALLIWVRPLTSIGWKRVDYIWLPFALIGALGIVTTNRISTASSLRDLAETRVRGGINFVRSNARFGVAICQTLQPAPGGPPPAVVARIQDELDEQCAWFKRLLPQLDAYDPGKLSPIQPEVMAGRRPMVGEAWAYRMLDDSVRGYNEALGRLAELESESQVQVLEFLIRAIGPTLLALALALRITRVTGEVRIERQKSRIEV